MVRTIMRDPLFLSQMSLPADRADAPVLVDLMDTLRANQERCVGMAANMIGVHKRIIGFFAGPFCVGMYNPEIISKSGSYETAEGCLSLDGERRTIRFQTIKVAYLDQNFKPQKMTYTGWVAQIIQHEIDHCNGILI